MLLNATHRYGIGLNSWFRRGVFTKPTSFKGIASLFKRIASSPPFGRGRVCLLAMTVSWSLLLAMTNVLQAQDLPYELLAPDVVSVNRLPMKADAFRFENRQLAEKREKESSHYFHFTKWFVEVQLGARPTQKTNRLLQSRL